MRICIALFLVCFSSVAADFRFTVNNASLFDVHLDMNANGEGTPQTGPTAGPGQKVETVLPATFDGGYQLRFWYKSPSSGTWSGPADIDTWAALGLDAESFAGLVFSFADSPSGPVMLGYTVENSTWWAFSQGYLLALSLFGAALGLYIVKKIRSSPSEI